jgi:hypothetical protein
MSKNFPRFILGTAVLPRAGNFMEAQSTLPRQELQISTASFALNWKE